MIFSTSTAVPSRSRTVTERSMFGHAICIWGSPSPRAAVHSLALKSCEVWSCVSRLPFSQGSVWVSEANRGSTVRLIFTVNERRTDPIRLLADRPNDFLPLEGENQQQSEGGTRMKL